MTNLHMNSDARQSAGPQLVAPARKATNARRVHTVPSTLTRQMRDEIAEAVSFGRSIAQTAKEYNCDRCVVTEVWLRWELAKMRAGTLRRAA